MSTFLYDKALLEKLKKWTTTTNIHIYGVNETRRLWETIADETNDSPIELPIIALSRDKGYNIVDGGTNRRSLSYDGADLRYYSFKNYKEAKEFLLQHNINDTDLIQPHEYIIYHNGSKIFYDEVEKGIKGAELAEKYCRDNDLDLSEIHAKLFKEYEIDTMSVDSKHMTVLNQIPVSLSYQLDVYARYADEADIIMRNLIFNLVNYPAFTIDIPRANIKHTASISINDTVVDNSSIPERFVEGNLTRLTISFTVPDAHLWDTRKLHNISIDLIMDDIYEIEYDPYFPDKYRWTPPTERQD